MEKISVHDKSNKIIFLEFLRVICALVVIIDHVVIAGIHIFDSSASIYDRFICYGISYWSHFAVPIFLMISGYLLLEPAKEVGYDKALGKYTKRMAIVIAFFGTIFAWMEIFFTSKSFALADVWKAVYNMLCGESWGHMWYLYTLIGIYLVLPIIKPIFQTLTIRTIDCFLCILFLFSSISPLLTHLTGFTFGIKSPIDSVFMFYFLMGRRVAMMDIEDIAKKPATYVWMTILMLCPFCAAYMESVLGFEKLKLASYYSPLIILLSVLVFMFFMSINNRLTAVYQANSSWGGGNKAHLNRFIWDIHHTHDMDKCFV